MKGHFKIIKEHSSIDLKKVKNNKIYDLLICSFIDILRISAPEIPFENEIMEFYLEMLIKWLILEEHIQDSDSKQTAFFYVLHQMAKLSALCLLFTTKLIEQVPIIINQFFYFLEKKKYNQQQYQDFLECISSTVNEYSEIPIDIVQILLSNLGKNKKDNLEKQAYDISFNVIKENKTILGNKIREFIIPKNQNKKEKKGKINKSKSYINESSSNIDLSIFYDSSSFFEKNNYLRIIKELSKISNDFLIKLLSEINNEGLNFNKKYFSYSSFDILRKILCNNNSYEIYNFWKLLCNNYFNYLQKDLKDDNDENIFNKKYNIYKCAIKFISRNDKEKLKKDNIYNYIKDSISFFLKNLSSKNEIEKCLNSVMKSLNWNIISFSLMSLFSSKNNKKNKSIKNFFFNIIKDNILSNFILQDFKDKKFTKTLNTLSKPFNLILLSLDNITKLYQISLNNNFKEDENVSYIINKIQNIFDIENISTTLKLMIFFYMSNYTHESMTVWYTLLHIIFTDKEIKGEENEIKFLNCIKFDDIEMNDLIKFFNQYIAFVDENSNPDSIKVLISILFTLEIFLCSIHYKNDEISESNKNVIYSILNDVVKIILNNNIINKDVYDIICKINLLSLHLCINFDNQNEIDIKIKQKLNEILFKDMSFYVFINEQIKPKYYVKLISTYYNMIDNLIIKEDKNESFLEYPNNFIELLKNERRINCLCFLNELSFYKIDDKFLDFYFDENLAENIMNIIEKEIKEEIIKNKNELIENIKEKDNEENQEIEFIGKKILPKIKLSTEIVKYELNYLLKNKSNDEKEKNNNIKKYIKTIFNDMFDSINSLIKDGNKNIEKDINEIDEELSNKKRKKEKKKKKSIEKEEETNKKINKIEDIISINYIQKYIDLFFYMCDIGISFSFRKLVKISNLMVVKDIRIRNYFISKVHNSLIKLRKSHRNLTRLYSIILIGLSDPNKNIEKNTKDICNIFLDMLKLKLIKYEDYLNNEGYIYIPEVYIFYLIIYFIFNNNINIYYQQSMNNNKNDKYFLNIINSYLKEVQKKFGFIDSTFLLKALNEMKKYECKNIKKIGCIEKENVFLSFYNINDELDIDNEEKIEVDFDKVKNSIIDNIMNIIYNNYLNDNKRIDKDGNGIYPQIPNILTGKDQQFKDNYLYNFNKSKNVNEIQNIEKNKDNNNNSSVKNSSRIKKRKSNKRFSFNEYFKEDNDDDVDEN